MPGFLHDYQIVKEYRTGVAEVCTRCHDRKLFRFDLPSRLYLAYHLKQTLKPTDRRFKHEYANNK